MTHWLIITIKNLCDYLFNIYNVVFWGSEENIKHGHAEAA